MAEPRETTAWAVAVVATLGMSVSYVDRQTLAAIAPSVTKALAIDNTQYGWLLSAFSLAYLAFAPIAGVIVDRLGARRGFALAVVAWSLVAGAHAVAFSFASLFVLRILLGTMEAPSFPAATQAIRRALPGARRPLAFGMLYTGSFLGAMIAAKLAIRLDAAYGWQWAFAGTSLIGLSWLPIWLSVTRGRWERVEPPPPPADPEGLRVAYSPSGRGLYRGAVPEKAPVPSWRQVITSPPVLRAIVAIVGSAPALMFVLNWTSKYLVDGWHLPKGSIGNLLVLPPLAFDVGAVGFGALASRRNQEGADAPTHVDLLLLAMVLGGSLALVPLMPSPEMAMALCSAGALGAGAIYTLVTADMLARVPVERASTAAGMTASAQSIAHVIAGPLVGWAIDRTHGYGAAIVAVGLVLVPTTLAFVAWPVLRKRERAA